MKQLLTIFCIVSFGFANAFSQDVPARDTAATPFQLKNAARQSFEKGDARKAREQLQLFLDAFRPLRTRDPNQWFERLMEVAREYLRAGELGEALKLFGEATDLGLPSQNESNRGLASAAGGLHRRLVVLDADKRYEILHAWTMPTKTRQTVRVVSSRVPVQAPPMVFTHALGERPRKLSFPIAKTGGVSGLFSTAAELIKAADDTGRLPQLTTELERISKQKIPNADVLLILARIAGSKREIAEPLVAALRKRAAKLQREIPGPRKGPKPVDPSQVVIAAICLNREELRPIGEEMLLSLIEYTRDAESWVMRPFLRRALALAIQKQAADSNSELFNSRGLKYWISSSGYNSTISAEGTVREIWLSHEDHILHLAGPRNDYLFFRYPLTGQFEFSCEAQDGGREGTEGGVAYGGLGYEAWGWGQSFKVWDADFSNQIYRPCPFPLKNNRATFNRLAISSAADGVSFASNRHFMWRDPLRKTGSPWIALRCFNDRRPIFRNFKITGNPVIPREVRMSDGNVLRGWLGGYYGQRLSSPYSTVQQIDESSIASTYDWFVKDGIIHGARRSSELKTATQGRLYYYRPLQNGESVSYEFLFESGKYVVHPALGRLAFLIEPNGVRLHWMTDRDREWSELARDNAVTEPLSRRGPKPLPLKSGDWNRVTVSLNDDTVTLSLNGTTIYQRPLEPENRRTFGFYHDRTQSAVRVRNVVMRGDWPERLTAEQLDNLTAISNPNRSKSDRHVLSLIFQDAFIAENSLTVHRRAAKMPAEQRYEYLSNWVLPNSNHRTFRLAGDFTPTHPAPIVPSEDAIDGLRIQNANKNGHSRIQVGGNLISPVFDLIRVAKELGQLERLRTQIEQSSRVLKNDDLQQRSKLALLMLVDVALGNIKTASSRLDKMFPLVDASETHDVHSRWPEVLAVWTGVRYPETREVSGEILNSIFQRQIIRPKPGRSLTWEHHIRFLIGQLLYLESEKSSIDRFTSAPSLKDWGPVSYTTARTRGEGRSRAHWDLSENQVDHVAGHEQDYLCYRIPLRGNFEVECDVTRFGWQGSHLMVAGLYVAPNSGGKSYKIGNFQAARPLASIDPPLARIEEWTRFRAVVRNGVLTTYFNGRKVHEENIPAEHEPWLALLSWGKFHGGVRDLRITGDPTIPESIRLSVLPNLPGWAPYCDETIGTRNSAWRQRGDLPNGGGIVGRHRPEFLGSNMESLLRYHRPMLEDGTIEYEFYYREGEAHTHPALDRLAFMLDPAGVRIHWITDGKYDRTKLAPANVFDEPQNRRGPERLPLKRNAWNRLQLKLVGDIVELTLNDQLVYRRKLESTNQRTFGLFHYADRTEARVRNIVWNGDWPRELPAILEQELAGPGSLNLDESLSKLTSVFEHDFTREGLPVNYFHQFGPDRDRYISVQPDGVHAVRPGTEEKPLQTSIGLRFRVQGDFDITVTCDQLQTQLPISCTALLLAILQDKSDFRLQIGRTHTDRYQRIVAYVREIKPDGFRGRAAEFEASEASSGRFRLARRGDKAYLLFAEGNSPNFRLIATETVSKEEIISNGIRLTAVTNGTGRTSVVWKNLSIRAEKLLYMPSRGEAPKRLLYVMNTDGTKLRQLTEKIATDLSHGSPAWSADGTKICFDTWGSSNSAQIYTVNSNGKEVKQLSPGNMPAFSPDGKLVMFSWSGRGATIKLDGTERKLLDGSGWGAQLSPNGKLVAFGSSGNVAIVDVRTNERKLILTGDAAKRFSYITYNMGWSRDSKRVCFKGTNRLTRKTDIAIANVDGSPDGFQVLYESETAINGDFSWHPDGNRILFSMTSAKLKGSRLFTLDRKNPGPPQLLSGQPDGYKSYDADWSRDGKQIVFATTAPPTWKEWTGKPASKPQYIPAPSRIRPAIPTIR